jgi:uncharacterized protein (TIGR03663 family)
MAVTKEFRVSRLHLILLLSVSAFLRFYEIGIKPPHFDEGINGHFVLQIWRDGFHQYDPKNFHGPIYFYLLQWAELVLGRSVDSFRIFNAGLSVMAVVALSRLRQYLGSAATWAAWLMALSPGFVFYGRYAIHETLFVLAQIVFVYFRIGWIKAQSSDDRLRAAYGLALAVVVLISTKETFVIFLGTWLIAELALRWGYRLIPGAPEHSPFHQRPGPRDIRLLGALGVALMLWLALFTGFFRNWHGAVDFFRAFDFWTETGTHPGGHEKPWGYWLELMTRYEWGLALGLGLAFVFFVFFIPFQLGRLKESPRATSATSSDQSQKVFLILVVLAGFGQWLAYSIIPYKTPWLILSLWPLFLAVRLFAVRPMWPIRVVAFCGAFAVLVVSAIKARALNFHQFANLKEPYVYVQTTSDYNTVRTLLDRKLRKAPGVQLQKAVVFLKDSWPIPYTLSLWPNLEFLVSTTESQDVIRSSLSGAGLIFADGNQTDRVEDSIDAAYFRLKFQLRDAYEPGWVYFREEVFADVFSPGETDGEFTLIQGKNP